MASQSTSIPSVEQQRFSITKVGLYDSFATLGAHRTDASEKNGAHSVRCARANGENSAGGRATARGNCQTTAKNCQLNAFFACLSRCHASLPVRPNPLYSSAFQRYSSPFSMAPEVGLEPTTTRLTVACSTIELLRNRLDGTRKLRGAAFTASSFYSPAAFGGAHPLRKHSIITALHGK